MGKIKDRLYLVAKHYGLSVRKLEQMANLNRGNVSNLTGAIGSDKLSKIHDAFPEINLTWLINGNGEMLIHNYEPEGEKNIQTDAANDGGVNYKPLSKMKQEIEFLKRENALMREMIGMKNEKISELEMRLDEVLNKQTGTG